MRAAGVVELKKGSYERAVERFVVVYVLKGSLLVVLKGSWLFCAEDWAHSDEW